MKTIKIITDIKTKKDGGVFTTYKCVGDNGRLIDLHFQRNVNTNLFEGMKKLEATFEYFNDCTGKYEYPLAWAGSLVEDSIKKIY